MRETHLTLPEIGFFAGTRGLLGAGIGLLLANRLSESQRKSVGWTLLCVGAAATIPLAMTILSRSRHCHPGAALERSVENASCTAAADRDAQPVGV